MILKHIHFYAMFQMAEENLLEAECDILVPAANKKQITLKKMPTKSKQRYSVTSSIYLIIFNFWAVIWLLGFQAWLLIREKGYPSL